MDKFFLKDLSSNGTRVNGRRLEKDSEQCIKVGDRVVFASGANTFVASDRAGTEKAQLGTASPAKPAVAPAVTPTKKKQKHATASPHNKPVPAPVVMSIDEEESVGAAERKKGAPSDKEKHVKAKSGSHEDENDDVFFDRLV